MIKSRLFGPDGNPIFYDHGKKEKQGDEKPDNNAIHVSDLSLAKSSEKKKNSDAAIANNPIQNPLVHRRHSTTKAKQLRPGFAINPLLEYPRKNLCFCGSSIKMKSCCNYKISKAIPEETAQMLRRNWTRILARELKINLEEPPN